MNKIGPRLQVHPTSVTSSVDRLERKRLVRRTRDKSDHRTTLVEILPAGCTTLALSMSALNDAVFTSVGVSSDEAIELFQILRTLREAMFDFDSKSSDSAQDFAES